MPRSTAFGAALLLLAACAPTVSTPRPTVPVYAGFDTWRYPGDETMAVWRAASPYRWVGYYLPSPCHRDESFAGRRDHLSRNGWGIAVIYVGQQVFEGQTPSEITETTVCSSQFLTADRGSVDARDAIARTAAEGFPQGSVIFLDIERTTRIPPELLAYYEAWIRTVVTDGRYRAGTYAHLINATALYTVAQSLQQRLGIQESIPFWIAGGQGFTLQSAPEGVGYSFARIWQGVLDASRTWGGRTLTVDENVARHPSPSAPDAR